jgi:branched-chain amino acid transport system substrate-binding protein
MVVRRRFLEGLALGSAALAGACRRRDDGTIVLGAIFGLTGENSSLGRECKEGIELALEEVNAQGGVLGRKVKVLFEDTRLDSTQASEKIQRLIDVEQVPCVLGDAASTPTLAAALYAEKAKVPLVSPSATNVAVTQNKRWVFRVCFTDDKQGLAAARFARKELGADRAAVLFITGNKYSEGLQAIFAAEFERDGGKIVAKKTFQAEETNVLSFLAEIKDAAPQIVFAPVYPAEVAKIGPTKARIGLDVPLLGTDGWDGPATRAKGVIESIEGSYFTDLFAAEGPVPAAKPFVEKYRSLHQKPPSSLVASGYDALKLVVDAIGRAGAVDPAKIRDALEATKGFSGVTGTFDIDPNHNAQKPVTVMKIEGGDFRYHTQIEL